MPINTKLMIKTAAPADKDAISKILSFAGVVVGLVEAVVTVDAAVVVVDNSVISVVVIVVVVVLLPYSSPS